MFLLLACSRLYTTSMYNIDVPYLTHLRMKSYIAHMNTYLTYLPTFLYLIVYSAIVKKEKKKEKRKMSLILRYSRKTFQS